MNKVYKKGYGVGVVVETNEKTLKVRWVETNTLTTENKDSVKYYITG